MATVKKYKRNTPRTPLTPEQTMMKKARKKYISLQIAWSLIKIDPSPKMYWNATRCCDEMVVDTDYNVVGASYCKARFCPTCASIRMATMMSKYLPVFYKRKDLHFVTLTRPTVCAGEIPTRLKEMNLAWSKIRNNAVKSKLVSMKTFNGLRKLELKVSAGNKNLYHPHFHIIVEGAAQAQYIVDQWQRINPDAAEQSQKVVKVWSKKTSLTELFKYSTKLTYDDDAGNEKAIPAYQLDIIIKALYGKRIFQTFGDITQCNEDEMDITKCQIVKKAHGFYKWNGTDWAHKEYNQLLTDYKPDQKTVNLVALWKNPPPPHIPNEIDSVYLLDVSEWEVVK